MSDKTQQQVIDGNIAKTMAELSAPDKHCQRSRTWQDPEGYQYLTSWSNSVLLRHFIRLYTSLLSKSEYRRKAQLDDAGRSVVRNQEEGYKRQTTSEYSEFIGFSQGSLEEVKGNLEDGKFIYRPLTILYPPLTKVRTEDLTYEIFLELINKTDYLLRILVESLEKKLNEDQKYYQVDQARIKDKIK